MTAADLALYKHVAMEQAILRNARIITPTEELRGALVVHQGRIAHIDTGAISPMLPAQDMEGDYLLPGLVELHTDSLERFLCPRPGVLWPDVMAAALAHDAVLARCGILTVLDAVCAEAFPREAMQKALFHAAVQAVHEGGRAGLFRARHLLHLRCETADPAVMELVSPYMQSPLLHMVSLMDHTPGQRQYCDVNKYREYYGSEGWSDSEFQGVLTWRKNLQRQYAQAHRQKIIALCRERGVPLASHDDATAEHVTQASIEGVVICEFPTTLEAAQAARTAGMRVLMGAPNLLLGRSHAGNVSVQEVLEAGVLDILSSDYAPYSLLAGAFLLQQHGLPLPRAVSMVSVTPAASLGMQDTGCLSPGARADILRVRTAGQTPHVLACWRNGMLL